MNLFYHPTPLDEPRLDEEESHHCIRVLRKKEGDIINIVDGRGGNYEAKITKTSSKSCEFQIVKKSHQKQTKLHGIHIAIAPTKNMDRIEWFVEKACELGVDEISFIQTQRSERKHMNLKRIVKKSISALKQSKNLFKTQINELKPFEDVLMENMGNSQKFMAFVDADNPHSLKNCLESSRSTLIFIGPEGDFTSKEVTSATAKGVQLVSLGDSVLRTETAGIIAAHTIVLSNQV